MHKEHYQHHNTTIEADTVARTSRHCVWMVRTHDHQQLVSAGWHTSLHVYQARTIVGGTSQITQ